MIHKLLAANMITMQTSSNETIKSSTLGVSKESGDSKPIIWVENRSNLLLNRALRVAGKPSPDIVRSIFFDEKHRLGIAGYHILQYDNRLQAPKELIDLLWMPRIRSAVLVLP